MAKPIHDNKVINSLKLPASVSYVKAKKIDVLKHVDFFIQTAVGVWYIIKGGIAAFVSHHAACVHLRRLDDIPQQGANNSPKTIR